MRTLLLSLFVFLISQHLLPQSGNQYTPENLLDMLGRSQYSPKLELLASDKSLKKSEVKNQDNLMEGLWYNGVLSLFFTDDNAFGENLHVLETLGFHLEEVQTKNIPMFEKGFLGITAFMKRNKVDKRLKEIDPNYVNDGKNYALADYQGDYQIKVQFNGEKGGSQVLRVYVYLKEESYLKRLKQDFIDFGPGVLMPQTITNRYYRNHEDPTYLNVIPDKGCESCFPDNKNSSMITFPDGSTFEGTLDGILGEKGTLNFKMDGQLYEFNGSFVYGEASGVGSLTFPEGTTVNGEWENGFVIRVTDLPGDGFTYSGEVSPDFNLNGKGIVSNDNISCEGTFMNGQILPQTDYILRENGNKYIGWINENFQPDGQGSLAMANSDYYIGTFVAGNFHGGKVHITFEDGNIYDGEYNSENQMHGLGTITYSDGQVVSGTFSNGQFNGGTGKLNMGNGSNYEGDINSRMNAEGKGKYSYPNGDYINCVTKNGEYTNAEGRLTLPDGTVYYGQLNSKMQPHGKGKVESQGGVYIEGTFSNNTFMGGNGFIKYAEGSAYKGEMDGEKNPNGSGTYYYVYNTDYVVAKFSKSGIIPGYGERIYSDGSSFKGQLDRQGNPNGQGTVYFPNGIIVTGKIINKKPVGSVTVVDGQQTWEGPVDDQYRPNGYGRYRTSTYSNWQTGTFSHGKKR